MEKRSSDGMIKIAVTGPESTGKSALTEALALHFKSPFVKEYAREYLEKNGSGYMANDIEKIASVQLQLEERASSSSDKFLFCDSDLLVCKIWLKHVFNISIPWIDKEAAALKYSHTFLMNYDLPWESDPLRENPENRDYLFDLYKEELEISGRRFSIISGKNEERTQMAIEIIHKLFPSSI